jgi:hypothetical protein
MMQKNNNGNFKTVWRAGAGYGPDGLSFSATSDGETVNLKAGRNRLQQAIFSTISRADWESMLDNRGEPSLRELSRIRSGEPLDMEEDDPSDWY